MKKLSESKTTNIIIMTVVECLDIRRGEQTEHLLSGTEYKSIKCLLLSNLYTLCLYFCIDAVIYLLQVLFKVVI